MNTAQRPLPPTALGLPLVGQAPALLWGDALGAVMGGLRACGDIARFRFGPMSFFAVNHPDYYRHILQDNRQNYRKSPSYDQLRPLVGNGLLTAEGDSWLRNRRLAQPAFHHKRLAGFVKTMAECSARTVSQWEARLGSGAPFDVAVEMQRLTLEIVGLTLFSLPLGAHIDAIGEPLAFLQEYVNERTVRPWSAPYDVPTPANKRAHRAVASIDAVVDGVIAARRRDGESEGRDDLLAMLMAARDEKTDEGMSDRQLRDECVTLMLAGHETTAAALAWAFYLLSRSPHVLRALRAELNEVLGGRAATFEDLPRLSYTLMVVQEVLRLYPPAWMIERQALHDDEIGGYRIPAKSVVLLPPYAMHRHPSYWENPEGFDPERFRPEREATRPKFAYLPFGGGPRICIGNQFALMEMQVVLATVLSRLRLDLVPGTLVEPQPLVTLRPREGVWVTAKRDPVS